MRLFRKRDAQDTQDQELVGRVYSLFEEYRTAYGQEWQRLEECERMYRGDHWYNVPVVDLNEPRPVTPIIQSTIENIAADLTDSFPEAIITPESPEDQEVAEVVAAIIKQNHDASDYSREYRLLVHDMLVGGYMVQEVGYDPDENNGLGGAYIRHVDARNIMFDPLCTDPQDGRAIIKMEAKPIKWLEQQYPDKAPFKSDTYTTSTVEDDVLSADNTKRALLLEYWWREKEDGRYKVHMCKVGGGKLLEDSRESKPEGYYSHGKYPFVLTSMYIRKGSCLGYGIVDMFKEGQLYSDKLDQIVLKNALMASRNKMLITKGSGFDADDLSDWSKEVHVGEMLNGVTWFATPPLPNYIMQYIQSMRQDIKEESGANDFSRGNTASGVTAASAIAALQEASSKRSRMGARQMHAAFREAVRLEIEVEREYNLLPREVLVTVDGEQHKATFKSAMLQRQTALGNMVPIEFHVSIKVQQENRWNIAAHNELILQMVQLQLLNPAQAVELMKFDGKEQVLKQAQANQQQVDPQQQMMLQELQAMPTPELAME